MQCMRSVGHMVIPSCMRSVGHILKNKRQLAGDRSTAAIDRPRTTTTMDGVECRECVFIFVSKLPRRGGDDTPRLDAREVGKLNTRADIHASRESYAHRRARGT